MDKKREILIIFGRKTHLRSRSRSPFSDDSSLFCRRTTTCPKLGDLEATKSCPGFPLPCFKSPSGFNFYLSLLWLSLSLSNESFHRNSRLCVRSFCSLLQLFTIMLMLMNFFKYERGGKDYLISSIKKTRRRDFFLRFHCWEIFLVFQFKRSNCVDDSTSDTQWVDGWWLEKL